jgi:hypothetical protein
MFPQYFSRPTCPGEYGPRGRQQETSESAITDRPEIIAIETSDYASLSGMLVVFISTGALTTHAHGLAEAGSVDRRFNGK